MTYVLHKLRETCAVRIGGYVCTLHKILRDSVLDYNQEIKLNIYDGPVSRTKGWYDGIMKLSINININWMNTLTFPMATSVVILHPPTISYPKSFLIHNSPKNNTA